MMLTARNWRRVAEGGERLLRLQNRLTPTVTPALATQIRGLTKAYSTTSQSLGAEKETNIQPWRDPAMRQYMFWNREDSTEKGKYSYLIEFSPESVKTAAKILSLSTIDDAANAALHQGSLPTGASLLGIGTTVNDFIRFEQQSPNVLFVSPSCPHAAQVLPEVLRAFPSIEWVHCRSAGIDFVESEELIALSNERTNLRVTNAKGQFSSSLAEYVIMACSYFAKDLPRLMAQQKNKLWIKYDVEELRGKTLGIIGYGKFLRSIAAKRVHNHSHTSYFAAAVYHLSFPTYFLLMLLF